jgi:hypothetical protein
LASHRLLVSYEGQGTELLRHTAWVIMVIPTALICLHTAQVKKSKILCIGAGGIGCELLKTLVLTGFEDIELV